MQNITVYGNGVLKMKWKQLQRFFSKELKKRKTSSNKDCLMEAICCCKELPAILTENGEIKTTIKLRSNF